MNSRTNQEEEKIIHGANKVRKPSCFFKLILSPTSQSTKLRIPQKFARKHRNELSTTSILKVPTGETQKVALIKEDNKLWFHNGWHEFMDYHSISYAFFLLFEYEGNSTFMVHIFDPTACEISYQCNKTCKKLHEVCTEIIEDDSEEASDATEHTSIGHEASDTNEDTSIDNEVSDANEYTSTGNEGSDANEVISSGNEASDANEDTPSGPIVGRPYWLGGPEEYEELKKSVVAAGISLPRRPFFVTKIKHYALNKGMYLNVPVQFSKDQLGCKGVTIKMIKIIEASYGGRQWKVRCMANRCRCTFGSGWIIFAREVGLEVGDVCVFEPTNAKDCVLKVYIAKSSQIRATNRDMI